MSVQTVQPGNPVLVFFQETKPDDIDKYYRQSNDADTGGGARDLRIRPSAQFWGDLQPFFPSEISSRQREGTVFSTDRAQNDRTITTKVSLWGPTNTRDEVRIARLYTIPGWEIAPEEFNTESASGTVFYYLLVLDDNDRVWARTMRSTALHLNDPGFQDKVTRAQRFKGGPKKTARGVYRFTTNSPPMP